MANEMQLDVIRQGRRPWNRWRDENPDAKVELAGANLQGQDLRWVNLKDANLSGANLSGSDLREADLRSATLTGANLSRSTLSKVNAVFANFAEAILAEAEMNEAELDVAFFTKANLIKARIRRAKLRGANLIKANLTGAIVSATDLRGANLREATLTKADLEGVNLCRANLFKANLREANLRNAKLIKSTLKEANLRDASLRKAVLKGADLSFARLKGADLSRATLQGANLEGAELIRANLVDTNLERAVLANCSVYGISAWGVKLCQTDQSNLVITPPGDHIITVDNIEVAQFIYLLLYNERIRNLIDTISAKVVLILGRFTPERKAVLDAVRVQLREYDYIPVMFDFEKPRSRDFTETISTLAHLARFIIVDITEAKSVPQELQAIVPTLSVPVQPLLQSSEDEYGMFSDFKKYPWVLEIFRYEGIDDLVASLVEKVFIPAEAKAMEFLRNK